MKKSIVISMTLFAFAFEAVAGVVTQLKVERAVSGWAESGVTMGRYVNPIVLSSAIHMVTDEYGYYAVKMADGSTVFTSNDDEFEPVIAFTSNPNPDLSEGSPLKALLDYDIRTRLAIRAANAAPQILAVAAPVAQAELARRKWAALADSSSRYRLGGAGVSVGSTVMAATTDYMSYGTGSAAPPAQSIDDVRVAPLLKTKWSQQADKMGNLLYNYYTPGHYPCGCTATANGQIMNYFRYPTASMPQVTYSCEVDGLARSLTTYGGIYDWDLMAGDGSDVNVHNTPEQRVEIGKLLYDVGVALESEYTYAGTGALMANAAKLYHSESFGYKNAYLFFPSTEPSIGEGGGGLHNEALRRRAIYANLDAKRPVQFGILDGNFNNGHAVVGDGYGYKDVKGIETSYVHVNLGWAGTDDAWYNLPEINSKESGSRVGQGGIKFEILLTCAFNISPDDDGDILSGRAYDDYDQGMACVTVKVYQDDSLVGTTETDENGIYAFTLPGDMHYRLVFEAEGYTGVYEIEDVYLPKTKGVGAEYKVSVPSNVGNSWGNDMLITQPSVRNVRLGLEYTSLDKAISTSAAGDRLEVFRPTYLHKSVTAGHDLEILTVFPDDPRNGLVHCDADAMLTIAEGAVVSFRDIAFDSDLDVLIEVKAGSVARFAGDLGVGTVRVADADGFVVNGPVSLVDGYGFRVDSAVARAKGGTFGSWTAATPEEAAGIVDSVKRILNAADYDLGGVATETGLLVWGVVPVDPQIAVAYVVEDDEKVYYRTLDKLFKNSPAAREIFMLRDCPAESFKTNALSVARPLRFVSEGGSYTIRPSSSVSFDVDAGGSLVLDNVRFADYKGEGLFRVNAGGTLTLTNSATLVNLTAEYSDVGYGPVAVLGGTFNMYSGTTIIGCKSMGRSDGGSYGGGVFVTRSPVDKSVIGTANLLGGTISDCVALTAGGGVYVGSNSKFCSKVNLGGDILISGNFSRPSTATTGSPDDVWIANAGNSFMVVSALTGLVGVRVPDGAAGSKVGEVFASAITPTLMSASAAAFFKDKVSEGDQYFYADSKLVGGAGRFAWAYAEPNGQCDESLARCRVIYSGGAPRYYEHVSTAFAYIEGNCTLEMLDNDDITTNAVVNYDVLLRTAADARTTPAVIGRGGDWIPGGLEGYVVSVEKGATLTVTNLILSGVSSDEYSPDVPVGRLLSVSGGTLVLESGAVVCKVTGGTSRADSGVVVDGGTFRMESGSTVCNCVNPYFDSAADYGIGAGVLIDRESTGYLFGGEVYGCSAYKGGGVAVCNDSVVNVSGDFSCHDNDDIFTLGASNLLVEDLSTMNLVGELVSSPYVGRIEGVSASTNVFGRVPDWASWDSDALTNSAAQFRHDSHWDIGVVAQSKGVSYALLVWRSAVIGTGVYTDEDGRVWKPLGIPDLPPPEPRYIVITNIPTAIAFSMIVRSNETQTCTVTLTNLVKDAKYSLFTVTDLSAGFDVGTLTPFTNFNAETDGPFTITVPSATPALFWKATGETTYITNYLNSALQE